MNIFIHVISWIWALVPIVDLLSQRAGICLALADEAKLFSKVTLPFWTPPATQSSGVANTCQVFLFCFSCPDLGGSWFCISLMTNKVKQLSICIGSLDILFSDVPIQIFCLLNKKGVGCLFLINLKEIYVYCRYESLISDIYLELVSWSVICMCSGIFEWYL